MARRKLNYREGDWVAVPVWDGGWVAGLVARVNGRGIALGYFFGPRRVEVPVLDDLVGLKPEDAVLVGMFGDLGLMEDEWRVVGPQPGFRRVDWPMPVFVSHDEIRDLYSKRWYDEDTLEWGPEEWMPRGVVLEGWDDALMGSEFVERRLNRLLPCDGGSGVVG